MADLLSYRRHFDSLSRCCYLISNSLGAMPNAARSAAAAYADQWAARGVRAWHDEWWELPRTVGDHIGAFMHAAPDTVAMQPNVTTAEAVILSCFDFAAPRNKIVMVDMEFPSIKYLCQEWAAARGGRVEIVPCPDGVTVPTERLLEAIDEATLLVPISHVLFRSSFIIDAPAVIEKAHRVGARVVLDVYQSLGSIPVDLGALDADFAVGGCLKWLCGGPGAAFLYVRPDLIGSLRPSFTGWLAHDAPFAFEPPPIRRAAGSYRFLNGTPVIPALYTCRPGLDLVSEIGIERIRAHSQAMTARLLELARLRGWKTTAPEDPARRAGTVAIDLDHGLAIATELNARSFLCDYRPRAGIRLSPHFYNTEREIEDVIAAIETIIAEGAYRKHLGEDRVVT
ncbi:MAG TPA: aminotransferase class V-fold PLP-dependent enzyme [candidate division Zixibacteria bacterium]|nr:aminotransferase class V-fold PLP-dependent enzyme [candidate division Zixibacteria bacterium]MDD4918223.1 aminotransferase class V-fold PLP-dependent enzyme [candidate division Zixibacteria bacterium]MDM7971603.1 aminotransferase class V-fold PLP-dependent enzyme [candidate division Zixibacteria bacterium]HOD66446.1 aminotransferase class V-fold PLP-dependent enzyme [candidate division Zixibacteria bacterium]HPI31945.1 aminotransferase class V-fold PLP-dependent enzyme [candidate division Z